MKILYAFQCTGNGHIARAQEFLPILQHYAEVEVLVSGHQSQLELPVKPNFEFSGISLMYNSKGGLSYPKIWRKNSFLKAFNDILQLDLSSYDLILNDFEPISAWAAKKQKLENIIGLSHQASLWFEESPKPDKEDFFGKWVLKNYAPVDDSIGFHFQSYHPSIHTPIIRSAIRNLVPQQKGFYMSYLPSYSDEYLINLLSQTHVEWKIFSKFTQKKVKIHNLTFYPIDQNEYLKAFSNSEGVLCNAGFETPSEALYLQKKLMVIPIHGQYEQQCNAEALKQMGVSVVEELALQSIMEWIDFGEIIPVDYPDESEAIIRKLLNLD